MGKNAALLKKYKEEPRKLASTQKDDLVKEYAPQIKKQKMMHLSSF